MHPVKIKYYAGVKYQLAEDVVLATGIKPPWEIQTLFIDLDMSGVMTIREWYCWDGPSGPTIDSPSSMPGSLFHDAGYQLMREGFLPIDFRPQFDQLLHDICEADGMCNWRADLWQEVVEHFAKSAAEWENERPVIEAP